MTQRLLVVEDSKPIATVIKQIAQSLDYEVVIATHLAQVEDILSGDTDFLLLLLIMLYLMQMMVKLFPACYLMASLVL